MILATQTTPWLEELGRFHVVIVHFPFALLVVAAVAELWSMVRRRGISRTARVCLVLGALAAAAAAGSGWVHAGAEDASQTLSIHRRLGIATAAISILTL